MYQKLDEILSKVQEKPYQPFRVHNPEGRDLLFKGKEIRFTKGRYPLLF